MINNVQLITYVDRIAPSGLQELKQVLDDELELLFGGVHLLPFYYPIDGSDAGFDPIDHVLVDQRLGNWGDVRSIGEQYDIVADLIVNHMSAESKEFKDVLAKGKNSQYWDLFLSKQSVFPDGLSQSDENKIYRPRPGSCFTQYTLADGTKVDFWTTFTANQIDINVHSEAGQAYLRNILQHFHDSKVKLIRLDAAGYAIKKPGTSCFMIKESFDFIDQLAKQANALGMTTLAEIHTHHLTQVEVAKKVDMVYDFALPPLILHTLFSNDIAALQHWLSIAPRNCVTVLDTHDGIGIIDVGPINDKPGLLSAKEIDNLVNTIHTNTKGESLKATGAAANNVDLYQVNSTYYDALGQKDIDYLIARAVQFFAPGIPQVYYTGLFAIPNDMALLSQSQVGRDINRPYLNQDDIKAAMAKPFVKGLCQLIRLRNHCSAFNGTFSMQVSHYDAERGINTELQLCWLKGENEAKLTVDFTDKVATIDIAEQGKTQSIDLASLLAS